jgi:hypothetical protein
MKTHVDRDNWTPREIPEHRGNHNAGGPVTQRQSAAQLNGKRAAQAVYSFFFIHGPGTAAEATRVLVPMKCATGSTVTGQIKWLLDHGFLRDTGETKLDPVTRRSVRIVEVVS